MIYGVGTDIVQQSRIDAVYRRFGEHFVNRLLLDEERALFEASNRPARFLAMRFAAKELGSLARSLLHHADYLVTAWSARLRDAWNWRRACKPYRRWWSGHGLRSSHATLIARQKNTSNTLENDRNELFFL